MDKMVIWNNFLDKIKEQLTSLTYETWFKDTKLFNIENGKATIIVPYHVHKKILTETYLTLITDIFNQVTGTNFEFDFILNEDIKEEVIEEINTGIPYNNPIQANLNPNYTFDNYVVGNTNKFARINAIAVAENPGKIYNPLFIYGSSGLGKTHLMHAIGNYIVKSTNKKVLYVTSDDFVNDFVGIHRKNNEENNFDVVNFFKEKYRKVDVLIIDDIQFLGNATGSQQEFFNTFNELHQSNKQIIISSDRSPEDLKLLEERLRTRFTWGLTVNIYPPDYDLRVGILKNKAKTGGIENNIEDSVLEYIASNCTSDVRQLEGALTRVVAYAAMYNTNLINLNIAIDALKDYLHKSCFVKNDIQKIQKLVAEYYQIQIEDMKSKKRVAKIAYPRQIAMYLARNLTDESFPRIGIEFGGKDHSTIIHACTKIEEDLKINPNLAIIINKIKEKLK